MTCAEDARLKQIYETAMSAWLKRRQSFLEGVWSREDRSIVRKQLLQARLEAANDLYDHSLKCQECKASAQSRFDGDLETHEGERRFGPASDRVSRAMVRGRVLPGRLLL
jgi:hypothetical protein